MFYTLSTSDNSKPVVNMWANKAHLLEQLSLYDFSNDNNYLASDNIGQLLDKVDEDRIMGLTGKQGAMHRRISRLDAIAAIKAGAIDCTWLMS